ncbi:MAG: undecaprenyl-diphosphate phosphatase [Candidatus Kappaea frigidicola]|nr:undecaprenyl-diphosphate phosphatase [Candidatus Kappaea frigidicola]
MTLSFAIVSGIIQGLTEFLPVSSSGHLVLLHSFFGFTESQMLFDIFLHLGTLFAVVLFFRFEIAKLFLSERKMLLYLILAMIPAACVGIFFHSSIKTIFTSPKVASYLLIINGLVLFLASFAQLKCKNKRDNLNILDALLIGVSQIFGLLPGISRSGITISAGLFRNLDYKKVITFSFLLSTIAIGSAVIFEILGKTATIESLEIKNIIAGLLAAFISGIISIRFLISILKKKKFWVFAIYSIVAGITSIILLR